MTILESKLPLELEPRRALQVYEDRWNAFFLLIALDIVILALGLPIYRIVVEVFARQELLYSLFKIGKALLLVAFWPLVLAMPLFLIVGISNSLFVLRKTRRALRIRRLRRAKYGPHRLA